MKNLFCLLLAACMLFTSAFALAEPPLPSADTFMTWIMNGDTTSIAAHATPEMNQALPEEMLGATIAQLGEFSYCQQADTETVQGYLRTSFHVIQGGAGYTYFIVLDADGMLAGLNIQPWQTDPALMPDAPQNSSVITETVALRPGAVDETVAHLTLPESGYPCPVVILVQGSGPSDYNSSVYGIRPFEDLAIGLAEAGIASVRYDKYTYAHARQAATNPQFSIEEEYILDARAALEVLKGDDRFSGIYLMGHSQGGMLMPRIIHELGAESFAGGISLSGTPLHLWEIQYLQNLAVLETLPEAEAEAYRPLIEAEAEKARSLYGCSPDTLTNETVFGLPAYYQWDEISYDVAALYELNAVPCLALQGDADWQVLPSAGADQWRERCPSMAIQILPHLTHLLTWVDDSTGTQADYVSGSHVDPSVIEAVAAWILLAE